jgi:transposase
MTNNQRDADTSVLTTLNAIFISMELSKSTWLMTSLLPDGNEKMSKFSMKAGDIDALKQRLHQLRSKVQQNIPIISIHEAGLDGFWVHRVLEQWNIESHIVDAASVATPRRGRRAKTDRLDGETLVRALLAYKRGEPRVCSMVVPLDPEEEDRRRHGRERRVLVAERVKIVNRIKGLLFSQGVTDFRPLNKDRRTRLAKLMTGDGRELPTRLKAEIIRGIDRLELLLTQIKAVEVQREEEVEAERAKVPVPVGVAKLMTLRGIGSDFADVLWSEGLFRDFANRRKLASYAGLTPTPWQSGSIDQEQGMSKAGNHRLRTAMVQVGWFWLLHQPASALSRWFQARVSAGGVRRRKPVVIALARKLLVALWKFVREGTPIEGAVLKTI